MNQLQIHAPPPIGYGVYWAIRQNWAGAVLFGTLFSVIIFFGRLPWVRWETANQERAYAAALGALDPQRYQPPRSRLDAELLSEDGVYTWTMTVWEKPAAGAELHELLFTAVVDRHNGYRVVTSRLDRQVTR